MKSFRFNGICVLLLVYGLIDRRVSRPAENLVKEGLDIGNKPKIQEVGSFEKPVEAKELGEAGHNPQTEKVDSVAVSKTGPEHKRVESIPTQTKGENGKGFLIEPDLTEAAKKGQKLDGKKTWYHKFWEWIKKYARNFWQGLKNLGKKKQDSKVKEGEKDLKVSEDVTKKENAATSSLKLTRKPSTADSPRKPGASHKKVVSFENDGDKHEPSPPDQMPKDFDYPALAKAMEIMDKDGISTVKTPHGLISITEADPKVRAQKAMETHILHNLMSDSFVNKVEAEVLAEHPGIEILLPKLKFLFTVYQAQTMSDADATVHFLNSFPTETIKAIWMFFSGLDRKELQQVLREMGIAEGASAKDLIKAMLADDKQKNFPREHPIDFEDDNHVLHGGELSEELMKKWTGEQIKQHSVNETPENRGDTPLPEDHGHPNSPTSEAESVSKYDSEVEDHQAEDPYFKILVQFAESWLMEKPRKVVKVQDAEGIERIINSGDYAKDLTEALFIHIVQDFFTDRLIERIERVWGEEYPQFMEHFALFKSTMQEAKQEATEILKNLPTGP